MDYHPPIRECFSSADAGLESLEGVSIFPRIDSHSLQGLRSR